MRYITFGKSRRVYSINNIQKISHKKATFLSIGTTCFLLLFVSLNYEPLLGPDDVGIRNILSGLYTGMPDAHTYFMRYVNQAAFYAV